MYKNQIKFLFLVLLLIACTNHKFKPKERQENSKYEELKSKMRITYNDDKYAETLQYIDQLLQMDSTDGEVFFKKGYCESGLDNSEESIEAYSKAAQLNYKKVDALFNIGANLLLKCDSLAEIYFKQCLAINPNYEKAKIQLQVIKDHPSKYYNNCK